MTPIKPIGKSPFEIALIGIQPKSSPSQSVPAQSECSEKALKFRATNFDVL